MSQGTVPWDARTDPGDLWEGQQHETAISTCGACSVYLFLYPRFVFDAPRYVRPGPVRLTLGHVVAAVSANNLPVCNSIQVELYLVECGHNQQPNYHIAVTPPSPGNHQFSPDMCPPGRTLSSTLGFRDKCGPDASQWQENLWDWMDRVA